MRLSNLNLFLPRWTQALLLGGLLGVATLYAGMALHHHLMLAKLEQSVDVALDRTWADIEQLLMEARDTLTMITPLAGLRCEPRVLDAMRREVDLRQGIRAAFIMRDNGLGCSTYEGAFEVTTPASGAEQSGLRVMASDATAAPPTLVHTLVSERYSINSVVSTEALTRALRRSSEGVEMVLQAGDAYLDETARGWERRRALDLALHLDRHSPDQPLTLHGGLPTAHLMQVQQRELTMVLGRLMFISVLVTGLVFTALYNGAWLGGRQPQAG